MIPKVIHYCWFGGTPLPKSALNCIESWKKYFPDYEIKEWNETNFDINCCEYVKEAYQEKKWAFVSDYARFWILYNYGGVYFDTDVEVIKSMDELLKMGSFMGCEASELEGVGKREEINPGLGLAAVANLGIYKEILEYYNMLHFNVEKLETIVDHTTRVLKKYGFKGNGIVEDVVGIIVYPSEYFCPMNQWTGELKITENTYSIHHYTATWQTPYSRFKSKLQKIIGKKMTKKIIEIKKKIKGL